MFFYIREDGDHYFDYSPFFSDLKMVKLSSTETLETVLFDKHQIIELAGTLIDSDLYKGWTCAQGIMYEDFGNKFKLYPRANEVVAVSEQLYGYRQRDDGTIGKTKQKKTFLEEVKISNNMMANVEKYVYYMELMNADDKKIHTDAINYITSYSLYRASMSKSEEDKNLYLEYMDKYKEKLKRYWNI
ncbi:hypothetical protein GKC33_02590 [Lactobacillus salivarius]|uniref:Uncharacterized protein n=1 Tax=Ligilactobacillus salivarius TaxID=1624 RepID=A0A6A8LUS2_9LACO|nr:hypothetical protein [Ligilactobacillus salivarius]MSE07031.1 hypothetical protein [Ligilactobacillus salivarius]MSE07647.1 hypothetical protein [Ligilactobacillus salivarius]